MKNFLSQASKSLIGYGFFAIHSVVNAANDNILGISDAKLKTGDIGFGDIPRAIISLTNWLLGLSGTLAVFAIIYGAFRIAIGSVPGDKDTGKKIIQGAVIGFVIAAFSWTIVNAVISNL